MQKGWINLLGKKALMEKFPWAFIIIVFFGSELGLYLTGYSSIENINTSPVWVVGLLFIKIAIFAGVTFIYLSLRNSRLDKEPADE